MKPNRALPKDSRATFGLLKGAALICARITFVLLAMAIAAGLNAMAETIPCESLKATVVQGAAITSAETVAPGAFMPPAADQVVPPAQKERAAQAFKALPAFCRVAMAFKPSTDSDIKVEVWMPASGWNGRFLGVGNGGWGGEINYNSMAGALREGFATGSSDMGTGGFSVPHPVDLDAARIGRQVERLRLSLHAPHDRCGQDADSGALRNGSKVLLLERMLDGRKTGAR